MRINGNATGSKIGRALRVGGMEYFLSPVNHRETSQKRASVSSRMRKTARYVAPRRRQEQQAEKTCLGWISGVLVEACVSLRPPRPVAVCNK